MLKLEQDFFDFIERNKISDTNFLRLSSKQENFNFDLNFAITQIECRKKNTFKLKNFISSPLFLFPDVLSSEQSSHQSVAIYHSHLIYDSENILDMTAGLGIDAISIAKKGAEVTAVEIDDFKADVLQHNIENLEISNIRIINNDSLEYIKNSVDNFSTIFVDPSRRGKLNLHLYNLKDCSPNIIDNQELLLTKAPRILIKASPLLDITQTLRNFKNVVAIRAIGVKGECKEILIEINKNQQTGVVFEAINLDNEGNITSFFSLNQSDIHDCQFLEFVSENDFKPMNYILEPSAMVMKFAPWNEICKRFKAKKFGNSSHLFITNILPENFPGRITQIEKIIKKADRKSLNGFPASVVSRNHPLSPDEIRKSLKLKEGDEYFIYASRIGTKPIMLLCKNL